jgi:hypothetical protein
MRFAEELRRSNYSAAAERLQSGLSEAQMGKGEVRSEITTLLLLGAATLCDVLMTVCLFSFM